MRESGFEEEFEEKLQRELRRVDAPEGFADRIMGRVALAETEQRRGRLIAMPRRFAQIAIAAMLLIAIVLSGWQWREQKLRRERQEAQTAHRQFEAAMQVTGRTLVELQERIGRAGEIHSTGRKREVE